MARDERVFSAAGKMLGDLQKSAKDSTLAHSLFAAAGSLGCTLRELRLSTEQIGGDDQEAIAALIADAAPDAVEAGRAPTLEAGEGVVTVCFG